MVGRAASKVISVRVPIDVFFNIADEAEKRGVSLGAVVVRCLRGEREADRSNQISRLEAELAEARKELAAARPSTSSPGV